MAKITVVASLLALMFCVMISGCGSPYKAANYEDIVVGEKVCPYLSSDADMRGIPGAWSTVTAIQGEKPNQWVYLTHGDGSGGWREMFSLITVKKFDNGSSFEYQVRK